MDPGITQALLRRHLRLNVPQQQVSYHIEEQIRNTAADIPVMIFTDGILIRVDKADHQIREARVSFQSLIEALVKDGAAVKQHAKFHGMEIDEICHIVIDGEEVQLWLT
ncbi:MAG: hypothetical protein A3J07_01060 [Candidatus Doudnabacteria bacterium RIFCSPLOWO2_02_FULL_49_13]|uniref:Uncharacterized protein n=1 Tax=Candidatus Doudnabacteria bacterium RIFCSPHIGHO2_12_FULL_48_16 TaxID=1817838 RepID=A0A1F5PK69_9BACT|nr:MAG: hypothetical protein A3B77_03990 [Candidatus Doudnabacteria bacterium RIFCSPHIGHO2_02_FULL_49_24]OGE88648.1 MAG: hypothetical protein A2760_01650 [Candidatus Doudnabacteria bacterium RIFCSPHIGHO2_01_FULL_50_67]OGE90333.1 MAG: hypothetical protein A3E29_04570 [Candidatus Doudnabacteria bacterium RIFCSPHIGHO2_12_FULL_48_16]OGE97040.1 MAG: hypothetical protein A2990_01560 [Candidatus Doudnabacteria bacterium RIFCSPLOWO2_01_FULL_49_40]OGF02389.1 MAG: hypothetical protein A3J07_01060 [Candid